MIKLQDGVHINQAMLKLLSPDQILFLRTASFTRGDECPDIATASPEIDGDAEKAKTQGTTLG